MSNLGMYQRMTTLAKKCGGPKRLAALVLAMGFAGGVGATKGYEALKREINKKLGSKKKENELQPWYVVSSFAESNEGLLFEVGSKFRVLEQDGDAVLIEKENDDNNPYFVSERFLASISDYALK